jgi:hypothetical protein
MGPHLDQTRCLVQLILNLGASRNLNHLTIEKKDTCDASLHIDYQHALFQHRI